jgi:hypothetical protein
MFATVIDPHGLREEFSRCLVSAEEMGNNLSEMYAIRARRHLAGSRKLAQRGKVLSFTIEVLSLFGLWFACLTSRFGEGMMFMHVRSKTFKPGRIEWGWR